MLEDESNQLSTPGQDGDGHKHSKMLENLVGDVNKKCIPFPMSPATSPMRFDQPLVSIWKTRIPRHP